MTRNLADDRVGRCAGWVDNANGALGAESVEGTDGDGDTDGETSLVESGPNRFWMKRVVVRRAITPPAWEGAACSGNLEKRTTRAAVTGFSNTRRKRYAGAAYIAAAAAAVSVVTHNDSWGRGSTNTSSGRGELKPKTRKRMIARVRQVMNCVWGMAANIDRDDARYETLFFFS